MRGQWLFRQVFADLFRSRGSLRASMVLLSLATFSLLLVLGFESSGRAALQSKSRSLLGGDLKISAFREFSEEESRTFEELLHPRATSEIADLRTILNSTFVRLYAVDSRYPLLGSFRSKDRTLSAIELNESAKAWLSPEALNQLSVKLGDRLPIGKETFTVAAILEEDPSGVQSTFTSAPRIYIGLPFLKNTGLSERGSQVNRSKLFELSPSQSRAVDTLRSKYDNSDLYILSPEEGLETFQQNAENFDLVLKILSFFLIFLCLMTAFHQWATHFQNQLSHAQIYLCFGANRRDLYRLYFFELLLSQALACAISIVVCSSCFGLANLWLRTAPYRDLELRLSSTDLLTVGLFGLLLSVGFLFYFARLLKGASPARLLQESSHSVRSDLRTKDFWLPSLLSLLTAWKIFDSLPIASLLTVGLLTLAVVSVLLSRRFFRYLGEKDRQPKRRLRWIQLSRPRLSASLIFSLVFFLALLFSSLTLILRTFQDQIAPRNDQPDLFVFNVPEEEVDSLKSFVESEKARFDNLSPMIVSRILEKNGKKFEDTFFNRFPVRLTYREHLFSSERNVKGPGLPNIFKWTGSETIPLSLEERYSKRRNLKIGDRLKIDVLGMTLDTEITSLRRIDWLQFHPNFFIQMPPGVLEDAPKTFLASVYAISPTHAAEIARGLNRKFPTVSVLDIRRTVAELSSVIDRIRWILAAAFLVAIFVALLLLSGLFSQNLRQRQAEMKTMEIFGIDRRSVRNYFLGEYFSMMGFAGLLGFVGSFLIATTVTYRLFYAVASIDVGGLAIGALSMSAALYFLISYFFKRARVD